MLAHRIHLFGYPRIEENGHPIPLGRSKALALMAYLCHTVGPQSRDTIIDLLWPSFAPEDARNNLRRELSLLRRALPEGALTADRQVVGLDAAAAANGRIAIDTAEFEAALLGAGRHDHLDASLCGECVAALESAVQLYSDDFLAGFSLPDSPRFDDWQYQEAGQLRRSLEGALARLAGWHESRGEYERALEYARRRAALDWLDEATQRDVMRLFNAAGQHAAALRHYEQTRKVLLDELGVEPEPETQELFAAIKEQRATHRPTPARDQAVAKVRLPAEATPFIGRQWELDQLGQLLAAPDVRLITILGAGGMGKTRLGVAAARKAAGDRSNAGFPDGVFFVPLAPLSDSAEIAPALALNIGFTPGGDGNAARQLLSYLSSRRALLVIDNAEHLIDAHSITLVGDLLSEAPGVKLLVTSRTRLGLRSEHVFTLRGLGEAVRDGSIPADETQQYDAIALYIDAARRVQPSFRLDERNSETISQICQMVAGMPLAIELAAGWMELLTPEAILEELKRSPDLLEAAPGDAATRQAGLKAIFDSSWRLLTEDEQGALRCLSVFPGSFDVEAAGPIAGASLKILLSLANKSWVQSVGDNRFQVHPLLRQYASLEMATFGQTEAELRDRHALFFAERLASLDMDMRGRRPSIAFDKVAANLDNIRAAMLWLVGSGRVEIVVERMAIPLFRYLESRYHYFLFVPIILEALDRAAIEKKPYEHSILSVMEAAFFFNGYPTRFMDYHWSGPFWTEQMRAVWDRLPAGTPLADFWNVLLAWQYGRFVDVPAGVGRLRELLGRLKGGDQAWEEAFARQSLGRLLSRRPWDTEVYGPDGEARELLESALAAFERLGDEREAAVTLLFIGLERQSRQDLIEAKRILIQAQTRLRALDETIIAANINWQLGEVSMRLGEFDASLAYFHEMSDILLNSGRVQLATAGLSRESYEAVRYGDLQQALYLREQSLALSQQSGEEFNEAWDHWELGEIKRVMGHLEEARGWYTSSREIFRAIDNDSGESFYFRGLGDLALAEGDTESAEANFRMAIEWAERTNHLWQRAYCLNGLGKATAATGKTAEAAEHFGHALKMGYETGDPGVLLAIFGGVAGFYEQLGEHEQAQGLARIILSHSLSWRETRQGATEITGPGSTIVTNRSGAEPFELGSAMEQVTRHLEALVERIRGMQSA